MTSRLECRNSTKPGSHQQVIHNSARNAVITNPQRSETCRRESRRVLICSLPQRMPIGDQLSETECSHGFIQSTGLGFVEFAQASDILVPICRFLPRFFEVAHRYSPLPGTVWCAVEVDLAGSSCPCTSLARKVRRLFEHHGEDKAEVLWDTEFSTSELSMTWLAPIPGVQQAAELPAENGGAGHAASADQPGSNLQLLDLLDRNEKGYDCNDDGYGWLSSSGSALQGLLRQPLPWSQSFSAVPAFVSGSVARECCSMRPDPHARRTCLHQCLRLHPRRLAAAALPGLLLLSVDTKQTSILLRAPLSTASPWPAMVPPDARHTAPLTAPPTSAPSYTNQAAPAAPTAQAVRVAPTAATAPSTPAPTGSAVAATRKTKTDTSHSDPKERQPLRELREFCDHWGFEENTRRYLVGLPAKVQKVVISNFEAPPTVQCVDALVHNFAKSILLKHGYEDLDMDQFVARWSRRPSAPKAMEDAKRPVFGAEAERIGTRLDEATDEFLKETKSCRALQIPPGQDQLTAMEYVAYLGINLQLEPELSWEMLAAPMPPQAEMKVSKAGVCYFHDLLNDYYTIEHPLTQRYLKVLERQRLDLLCLRTKPSVNGLLFSQPDMLFNKQFRNLQIPCQSCGVMQSTLKCNQCLMSFCQSCADALHKNALDPGVLEVALLSSQNLAAGMRAMTAPRLAFAVWLELGFRLGCAIMPERRVDPDDGNAYTFDEVLAHYKAEGYTKKEVQSYWDQVCKPAKETKETKAAKSKATPPPKAKAEKPAKAKVKAAPKAQVQPEPKPKAKAKALRGAKDTVAEDPSMMRTSTRLPRTRAVLKNMRRRDKDWRIGAIVYQLFVDRFAPPDDFEAKKKLYPDEATFHGWKELPKGGQLVESAGYYSNELAFWGGDLPSLTSKLDYIDGLGIDVLYLQPITKSYSNHKYDTIDYKQLDSQYGTDADFKTLSDKVHDKGLLTVLKYFFMGDEYKPHGYKVWGCAPALVEFALENKELQKHLWDAPDSALATWLSKGADGARLDVASEIGLELLASITRAAHKYKKDSASRRLKFVRYSPHWTQSMDAVMSLHMGVLVYGLAEGVLPGPSAAQSLSRMIADSSMDEVLKCWIVVSNHDMPRLAHRLPDLQARKFAQCLQFTWPGCPLIYYGDELGLEGGEDCGQQSWQDMAGDYRDLPTTKLMAFIRTTDRVSDVMIVLANPTSEEMVVVPVPAILGHTLFKDDLAAA
eukprot:s2893_g12.t1